MPEAYNFLWLSGSGAVVSVESFDCRDDADAVRMAQGLLDADVLQQRFPNSRRIDAYLGTRLVEQVQRQDA